MNASAVAILYFNKIALTQTCVKSVLEAGYHPSRIFCFDNGSREENHEAISLAFPDINHMRISDNRGYSGGFNGALRWVFQSDYDSVLFCTNDTQISSGSAEACETAGKAYGAGIVAPCIYHATHRESIDSVAGYFEPETASLHHYRTVGLNPLLTQYDYVPGTALWMQRDAFDVLAGVDESYHTFWEDADLSFRAWNAGIPMARTYDAAIYHGVGRTCHKKPLYTTFYFQRNRIRFCRKHLAGNALKTAIEHIRKNLSALELSWRKRQDLRRLKYLEELYSELDLSEQN